MMLKRFLQLILMFTLLSTQSAFANKLCKQFFLSPANSRVQNNTFETNRDLTSYLAFWSDVFFQNLNNLKHGQHWLDLGSGESVALTDYFLSTKEWETRLSQDLRYRANHSRQYWADTILKNKNSFVHKPAQNKAEVIGITYVLDRDLSRQKNIKVLSGRYFEDIPDHELKPFDIATDLYGIGAYTRYLDSYLQRVFNLMKNQGSLFVNGWVFGTVVINQKGEHLSLIEWLSSVPGIQITEIWVDRSYQISKKPGAIIKIPKLDLISDNESAPPIRVFRVRN